MTTENIDLTSPEAQEAIKAQAAKLAEQNLQAKLADYTPNSEVEGLVKKKDELLGKLQNYKGLTDEELANFRQFEKQKSENEIVNLFAEGKTEEAINKIMSGQRQAWDDSRAEYEERIEAAQKQAAEYNSQLEELQEKNIGMQKRQYLKELTAGDDSFKSEHFGHFYDLYSQKADIDETTGKVYAKDAEGKRLVDASGDFVEFKEFYSKQKISDGLFWNGGSGSGYKGGDGNGGAGDISKMSAVERAALRKELGDQKYIELLRNK